MNFVFAVVNGALTAYHLWIDPSPITATVGALSTGWCAAFAFSDWCDR